MVSLKDKIIELQSGFDVSDTNHGLLVNINFDNSKIDTDDYNKTIALIAESIRVSEDLDVFDSIFIDFEEWLKYHKKVYDYLLKTVENLIDDEDYEMETVIKEGLRSLFEGDLEDSDYKELSAILEEENSEITANNEETVKGINNLYDYLDRTQFSPITIAIDYGDEGLMNTVEFNKGNSKSDSDPYGIFLNKIANQLTIPYDILAEDLGQIDILHTDITEWINTNYEVLKEIASKTELLPDDEDSIKEFLATVYLEELIAGDKNESEYIEINDKCQSNELVTESVSSDKLETLYDYLEATSFEDVDIMIGGNIIAYSLDIEEADNDPIQEFLSRLAKELELVGNIRSDNIRKVDVLQVNADKWIKANMYLLEGLFDINAIDEDDTYDTILDMILPAIISGDVSEDAYRELNKNMKSSIRESKKLKESREEDIVDIPLETLLKDKDFDLYEEMDNLKDRIKEYKKELKEIGYGREELYYLVKLQSRLDEFENYLESIELKPVELKRLGSAKNESKIKDTLTDDLVNVLRYDINEIDLPNLQDLLKHIIESKITSADIINNLNKEDAQEFHSLLSRLNKAINEIEKVSGPIAKKLDMILSKKDSFNKSRIK